MEIRASAAFARMRIELRLGGTFAISEAKRFDSTTPTARRRAFNTGRLMKRNILFVDDNETMLELYRMLLTSERVRWEVRMAGGGAAALQLLATTRFDVVVSDLHMPGMDGVALLREVKRLSPGTSRIILSGLTDQKEIAECLQETHQFIAKPMQPKVLRATLARIGGLDAYLQDESIRGVVAQLDTLPSFPSLYLEIMQELASDNPSVEQIATIVAKDPGMTVKMLQIVNAASLGLGRRITSPQEAVQQIGLSAVRSLALSAHIFSCFEHTELRGFAISQVWDHGMRTAQLARKIMELERAELSLAEDAYTAAMLHDVGKLMLANNLTEPFQRALTLTKEQGLPFLDAEQKVFGANHAGVGAYLLGLWGMPAIIVEAVAFHHQPSRAETKSFGPLTAVHVANVLEHELSGFKPPGSQTAFDMEHLKAIGLQNRVDAWRERAGKLFQPDG
ncbi:MAG: HDOD domain-containing protein [Verrucomicrobia subdivision 3 bacterium]|nr:HDOD domain-containing protein [Verrucomicrobiota bacterium]MCC6820582.1 HDOD domain-containing protein [Limisphaerales bacterium]